MLRVLEWSKPEWLYILIGCLASIINGGVNPAFAIVFSKIIVVSSIFYKNFNINEKFQFAIFILCYIVQYSF